MSQEPFSSGQSRTVDQLTINFLPNLQGPTLCGMFVPLFKLISSLPHPGGMWENSLVNNSLCLYIFEDLK
jgi:hypothetical protein